MEVQQALGTLQAVKTPGTDGLPAEFYRQYGKQLLPKIHDMVSQALEGGSLPASTVMTTIIVVIPKPDKDTELCSSCWPLSLLNDDVKILSKVLASRMNEVILTLSQESNDVHAQ